MANRANVSSLSTDIINQVGCEPRHLIISPWSQELRNSKQEERKKLRWLQATLRRHCWCWRRRTNTMRAAPPAPWSAARRSTPGIPYMRFFHIWIIILVSCTYAPPIDHCFIYTPTCSCMLRFLLDCLSNLLIIHVIFEKANGRALAFTHPHAISLL